MKFFETLKTINVDFTAKDTNNRTCLHYASQTLNHFILEYVLKLGLNINEPDVDGRTPLGNVVTQTTDIAPFLKIASKYGLDINKEFTHKKETYRFSIYTLAKNSPS